jgi:nucleoside 2-deoxyribosyltransferase
MWSGLERNGVLSVPLHAGIYGERLAMSNWADSVMTKRFYLATRKDRSKEADALSDSLKAQGWERTFVWTAQDNGSADEYREVALKELTGVRGSDVLVVLLPGGYGTHVEIGAAIALGKPVILHAPDRKTLETPYPCVFHYHPGVKLLVSEVLNVDEILACMQLFAKEPSTLEDQSL